MLVGGDSMALITSSSRRPDMTRYTDVNPVHISSNVEATLDFVAVLATKSNEFIVKFRPFDKVEANGTCSLCFDFVERTKFRSTLLPKTTTMSNNVRLCESNIRLLSRIVLLVGLAFNSVASTMLVVWTGLYGVDGVRLRVCGHVPQYLKHIPGARARLQPRLLQQQCRNNIVECYKSNDSFDSRMLLRH